MGALLARTAAGAVGAVGAGLPAVPDDMLPAIAGKVGVALPRSSAGAADGYSRG